MHDAPVYLQVIVHEDIAETYHPNPAFLEGLVDVAVLAKEPREISALLHEAEVPLGNEVAGHVGKGFDGKLQEALGAAVALRIGQEVLEPVSAQARINLLLRMARYSPSLERRRRRILGLSTEEPLFQRFALYRQDGEEVEVFAHGARVIGAVVEALARVHETVGAHGLEA